ncbi:SHOCT domain-containing protein [Aeromicrobium massiliense]|uniref:SHOCT domain-containing protein n=1 Tax=Aeromicrobium massiliense TaxID=1464554 RepID=UPI00030BE98C|nr:SHOCT domain-containing protein [Aeromicrobium massiliense]
MLVRRFGRPGLLGTIARTAVVAGTASVTANAVNRRQQARAQQQQEAAAYERQAQSSGAAAPSLGDQLEQLAALHSAGVLTDAELASAKRRLLG